MINLKRIGVAGRFCTLASWLLPSLAAIGAASVTCFAYLASADIQGVDECQSNLKQMALGVLMYVQDYDERYPPMKIPAQVQNRIYPYVKNRNIFKCPTTGADYLPNPALNYIMLNAIKAPAQLMMFRDAKPHTTASGKPGWNAAYADGHVKLVMTEPALGKPAPTPAPLTRAEQIRGQLTMLRAQRKQMDVQILKLEAEQRKTRRGR